MARINKLGTSWHSLNLEKFEEEAIKKDLVEKDISGYKLLRYLVRRYIKEEKLLQK